MNQRTCCMHMRLLCGSTHQSHACVLQRAQDLRFVLHTAHSLTCHVPSNTLVLLSSKRAGSIPKRKAVM